jgi:hypothetical protein
MEACENRLARAVADNSREGAETDITSRATRVQAEAITSLIEDIAAK